MMQVAIKGFEGLYEVTDDGRVWSVRRNIYLKPKRDRDGYKSVSLFRNGQTFWCRVHRLVANAFVPNPCDKPHVNHLNEDKGDNRVSNLSWVTAKENDNYGSRNERMAQTKSRKPVVRTLPDGREIHYLGVKDASRKTGIAHSQIRNACLGINPMPWAKEWRYA